MLEEFGNPLLRDRLRLRLEAELKRKRGVHTIDTLYPDLGEYRRALYPKHLEFFEAGAKYRERCALCANRIGKTLGMGGYETALHLTGRYPTWWPGRRFDGPIDAWAAGKTNVTTRDVMQEVLMGRTIEVGPRRTVQGNGLIPSKYLGTPTWAIGVPRFIDTIPVKHVTGGWSSLGFKSYSQGRGSFEGTARHLIWLDEEPPVDVYGECLIRTATTGGLVMCTFTPLEGMSDVVIQFLPAEMRPEAL